MISQLRIYTVNKGMTDQWVKHFTEVLVPMQEKHGIKIGGMWVNEDKNQFIWTRSFADAEDVTAKEAAFYGSAEWSGTVDHTRSHIARTVVQAMAPATKVEGDGLTIGPEKVSQLRMYTVNRGMMDQWVKLFSESIVPVQESLGMKIDAMWVNEDKNQFIWIRSFADAEDATAADATWGASSDWQALRENARSHLARVDVITMNAVARVAVKA